MSYLNFLGYLQENNISYDVIINSSSIKTLDDILRLRLAPERVVKSLILKSGRDIVVASIPMNSRLNLDKVRFALGSGAGFVSRSEIPNYGYEVGAVPPIYHRGVDTYLLDRRLAVHRKVLSGSGYTDKLIELKFEDIVRLSNPIISDISD